jgi:hypothetical protein
VRFEHRQSQPLRRALDGRRRELVAATRRPIGLRDDADDLVVRGDCVERRNGEVARPEK